jgi:hypothetical protein
MNSTPASRISKRCSVAVRTASFAACGLVLALGCGRTAQAQAYGPRQFWLAPAGTNVFTVSGLYSSSNTVVDTSIIFPNLNVDTYVVVPSYARFFGIGDRLSQVSVAVPYAWANVSLSTANRGVTPSKQGLADSYAHLTVGLVNTPALAPAEFGAYMQQNNPPVVVYGLMAVLPPTGDYQNDRLVNIGTNRWTFRAGLPTTVRLSPNWAPGKTTTFEILPSVDLYTPNNDPAFPEFSIRGRQVGSRLAKVLAPDQTTQAPMGTLEMHLTLDLNKKLWVSLDSYSRLGGETSSDGTAGGNQQAWTALGATIGGSPWSKARLSLTGGAVLAGNDNSPDGWQLRLQLQQSF